jgi:hypothetical protein
MNKKKKFDLIKRTLGIRHKLKVLDSMSVPEGHEELAQLTIARWELEDELSAIESILRDVRNENVVSIKDRLMATEHFIAHGHLKVEQGHVVEMQ